MPWDLRGRIPEFRRKWEKKESFAAGEISNIQSVVDIVNEATIG